MLSIWVWFWLVGLALEYAVFSTEWYARWWNQATMPAAGTKAPRRLPRGFKARPAF